MKQFLHICIHICFVLCLLATFMIVLALVMVSVSLCTIFVYVNYLNSKLLDLSNSIWRRFVPVILQHRKGSWVRVCVDRPLHIDHKENRFSRCLVLSLSLLITDFVLFWIYTCKACVSIAYICRCEMTNPHMISMFQYTPLVLEITQHQL